MKKLTILLMAMLMVFTVSSCKSSSGDDDADAGEVVTKELVKDCEKTADKISNDPSEKNLKKGTDLLFSALNILKEEYDSDLADATKDLIIALSQNEHNMSSELREKFNNKGEKFANSKNGRKTLMKIMNGEDSSEPDSDLDYDDEY